jgi:hypothetical protein
MDEFRIRARKMIDHTKEVFSASECALSKKPTLERIKGAGEGLGERGKGSTRSALSEMYWCLDKVQTGPFWFDDGSSMRRVCGSSRLRLRVSCQTVKLPRTLSKKLSEKPFDPASTGSKTEIVGECQRVDMWSAQAMLARGSMAAGLHTPFQTASKK